MIKLIHARGAPLRLLLALAGAACWVLALPSASLWVLAPLAPGLLVLACTGSTAAGAAGLGFLFGFASAYGIWGWMFEVAGFELRHSVVLGTYLGLFPALFGAALPLLRKSRLAFPAAAAAAWTALDVLRGHAGFLAFPWGTLGVSQAPNLPLLQAAAVLGEEGVTFLVALLGVSLAEALVRRNARVLAGPVLVLAFAFIGGAIRLTAPAPAPTLRVAAIQPAILREERATRSGERATLERLERLTKKAAAEGRPALIVWPETSVRNLTEDESLLGWVRGLADGTGATLIVGASKAEKFPSDETAGNGGTGFRFRQTNLAVAIRLKGAQPQIYSKNLLVPFAEYLPAPSFPWPKALVGKTFDVVPGEGPAAFTLADGTLVAPLVCWENLFSDYVRRASAGARVLVQLTNDNWFGATAAPLQHDAASIVRAVENGLPVVVSSNTGPSLVADARGRVVARAPKLFAEADVTAAVSPGNGATPFARGGHLFGLLASLAAAAALLDGTRSGRDSRP